MTIKRKLSLVVLLFTAMVLLLMNSFYYLYISNNLINDNKNEIEQTLDIQSIALSNFFHTREVEVKYLAKSKLVNDAYINYFSENPNNDVTYKTDYIALNAYFEDLVANNSALRDAFILSPKGYVMASSEPRSLWIDLSDRQYFIDAMSGKTTISNLLVDRVDGDSVLFVATPIYADNDDQDTTVIGVMTNIIDGVKASEMLRNLTNISFGKAYLIDQDGMIIFHTTKDLIGTRHVENEIATYFLGTPEISDSKLFKSTQQNLYVAYHTIENTPWRIVIEQNESAILSSAYRALGIMLLIALLVLVIATLIIAKFAKIIAGPIVSLSQVMRQTISGDLSVRSQHLSDDEVGQLAKDLNHMLDELTGAYEEVEAKNEELIATEEELRQNYEQLYAQKIKLSEIQNKYKLALDGSSAVIWEWDLNSNLFFASELWYKLTGRDGYNTKVELVAFEELIDAKEQERLKNQFFFNWRKKIENITFDLTYLSNKGEQLTFHVIATTLYDEEDKPYKVSGTLIDITKEKEMSQKIYQLAFTNSLTGFANRTAFITDITQIIMDQTSKSFSVFQFDIDHFARINDSLGHILGDQLLILVAERLKSLSSDLVKVYHLSADEYALVALELEKLEDINQTLKSIYGLFETPFEIEGRFFYISISMGITKYPYDGLTVERLVQNVDTAMYAAKKTNRSSYVFYESVMSENATRKIEIEDLLRTAIHENRVRMVYQPQFDLKSETFVSAEALMRLEDQNGKLISPLVFIPIAEETGLIVELGYWAFRNVCKTYKAWQEMGISFESVSVNVSVVQLKQSDFIEEILSIIDETGIAPDKIELEITESILLDIDMANENIIDQLKFHGIKVALDDFGTGYSSLSYLRQLAINTLKIDKSFINNLSDSKKDRELVRQVIGLAHELGLKVVAEGVETEEQSQILSQFLCDSIQGFYYSKPIIEREIVSLMKKS